jgi:hypothetical protein
MKSKWAAGIVPRNFAWIIKDRLAVSERPGGYARTHRRVRRQEEIIWLREQGFTRVVSILPSPHNLHAYEELGVQSEHVPFGAHDEPRPILEDLFGRLREWLGANEKVLIHQEELGDRVQGVAAGYLVWCGLVRSPAQAIAIVERINQRQMGPVGRELVAVATALRAGADASPGAAPTPGREAAAEPSSAEG